FVRAVHDPVFFVCRVQVERRVRGEPLFARRFVDGDDRVVPPPQVNVFLVFAEKLPRVFDDPTRLAIETAGGFVDRRNAAAGDELVNARRGDCGGNVDGRAGEVLPLHLARDAIDAVKLRIVRAD